MSQPVAPHPSRARIGRPIGKIIFSTLYRGRALHSARVPRTGPVILVANHAAFLDGPLVFGLAPRPVSFLVKQEAFSGFWGWTIRNVGQTPVDRSVGDRAALASSSAVLETGGAVGIFPEGNRGDGEVHQVNHGPRGSPCAPTPRSCPSPSVAPACPAPRRRTGRRSVRVRPSTSATPSGSSPTPQSRAGTASDWPATSCATRSRHMYAARGWRMVAQQTFTDSRTP